MQAATDSACTADGPDRTAESKQLVQRLYQHLQAIAPKKRLAFVLHVLEGRPIQEVAALVGASQTATKSRIFFARRALLDRIRRDPELKELLLAASHAHDAELCWNDKPAVSACADNAPGACIAEQGGGQEEDQ